MTLESQSKRPGWGCSLALLLVLVVIGVGLALLAPRALAFLANQAPSVATGLTDRTSPAQVATYRQAIETQLSGYGWVDQAANRARIPIARAIALVAAQGLPVGAPATTVATTPTIASAAPAASVPAVEPAQVDFTRDVLPIFERSCSNCHGFEEPEEGLVLTGYRSVMQGSNNGPVIVPGDPDKSYLVELIVAGKMPRRGAKLAPAEIALITAWVQGGALEAASAPPSAPITQTVAVTTPTAALTTTVAAAAPTQVDFTRDVLPIFEQRCSDCHGFEEPEEGLVLTGYKSVLQGSNNGPVIVPGDPDKSYLVELIVAGKMPKRAKRLPDEEIAIITAWVREGALEAAVAPAVGETTSLTPTATVTATPVITTETALTPTTPVTVTAPVIDPAQVDFQRDILPIFEQRCSDCHGFEEPEEDLVLTSYRSVLQGSKEGPVIVPGDPDQSYLVELIVAGKMPKRGKKLTPEEIALITAWVQGGALAQAPTAANSAEPTLTPTMAKTPTATVTVAAQTTPTPPATTARATATRPPAATATATATATKAATATPTATNPLSTTAPVTTTAVVPTVDPAQVSFQNDVLPLLEQRCSDCHGFEEPEEGLVLTGYRSVMQGSNNGPVVAPGDPEQSLLVELIVNGKMPKRGTKLTPAEIAIISAWVKGGAPDN